MDNGSVPPWNYWRTPDDDDLASLAGISICDYISSC